MIRAGFLFAVLAAIFRLLNAAIGRRIVLLVRTGASAALLGASLRRLGYFVGSLHTITSDN